MELPGDFFLKWNPLLRRYELNGALTVYESDKNAWIFMGSEQGLYQVVFTLKLHELSIGSENDIKKEEEAIGMNGDESDVKKVFAPYYGDIINMFGQQQVKAVSHVYALPKYQQLKGIGPINTTVDMLVVVDEVLAFYKYELNQAVWVYEVPIVNLIGTTGPVKGIAMTALGLYLATRTDIYFFPVKDGYLDILSGYNSQEPNAFRKESDVYSPITEINALTVSQSEDGKEFLSLATDAGILICREKNVWHELRLKRTEEGKQIFPNVTVAYVDKDGDEENVYYVSPDDMESIIESSSGFPSYRPYKTDLPALKTCRREDRVFEWPVLEGGRYASPPAQEAHTDMEVSPPGGSVIMPTPRRASDSQVILSPGWPLRSGLELTPPHRRSMPVVHSFRYPQTHQNVEKSVSGQRVFRVDQVGTGGGNPRKFSCPISIPQVQGAGSLMPPSHLSSSCPGGYGGSDTAMVPSRGFWPVLPQNFRSDLPK